MIGSTIDFAKELWLRHEENKKEKEYLCIKVSSMFDKFIHSGYAVVCDNGLFQGGHDSDGCRSPQVSLPIFETELENVNWKSLPVKLMYEILDFPNEVENANYKIQGAMEFESLPPDYKEGFEERQYQYALLCVKAFEISSKLRKESNLPKKIYEWDIIENMSDKISEINILKKDKVEE